MSFNLNAIRSHCDHIEALEDVYSAALEASRRLSSEYLFLETGTRGGGSALAILQAIKDSGVNRWLFTVDPYGEKPYKVGKEVTSTLHYGEDLYREAMKALADFAYDNKLLHSHFRMKSLDWMRMFDYSEFWFEEKPIKKSFGFAYLDGDHDSGTVRSEYNWLSKRTPEVSIVVDDAHYLDDTLLSLGTVAHDRLYIKGGNETASD